MAIPFICTDPLSACAFDHAPVGTSRDDYIALRTFLSDCFDKGYPIDASCLSDSWIEFIAEYCSILRIKNKKDV
jgi:hypothetical protein